MGFPNEHTKQLQIDFRHTTVIRYAPIPPSAPSPPDKFARRDE